MTHLLVIKKGFEKWIDIIIIWEEFYCQYVNSNGEPARSGYRVPGPSLTLSLVSRLTWSAIPVPYIFLKCRHIRSGCQESRSTYTFSLRKCDSQVLKESSNNLPWNRPSQRIWRSPTAENSQILGFPFLRDNRQEFIQGILLVVLPRTKLCGSMRRQNHWFIGH